MYLFHRELLVSFGGLKPLLTSFERVLNAYRVFQFLFAFTCLGRPSVHDTAGTAYSHRQ